MLGLVAGRELARHGFGVEVFERWPDVGGQASAFDLGNGVWLDRYYHHLFQSDAEIIALHDELLPGELEWHPSTVAMYEEGRLWPFLTPLDLLRYGPLPVVDRMRLGLAVMRLVRGASSEHAKAVPALGWLRANCGERAVDKVWRPLMFGKFGDHAESVPLEWLRWKLILRRGKLAGRGAARELLGYPRGSFRRIAVALAEEIRRHGGTIHLDREVLRLERDSTGLLLRCAATGAYRGEPGTTPSDPGRDARADLVLLTVPTTAALKLAAWPQDFAIRLATWKYRTAVVLLLELRERFGPAYWTNIVARDAPFLALIEHTNLVPAERYPARYLYVSNYVAPDAAGARMSTDDLVRHYLPTLTRIHPGFGQQDILRAWSFREESAQPVPRVGEPILPFETPLPGVYLANTTQIYPEDRGTNYSAKLGRVVAERIRGRRGE